MIVQGTDAQPLKITADGRAHIVSIAQNAMHTMSEDGKAWTLPFKQNASADINDNTIFCFENTSSEDSHFHGLFVSSQDGGIWTIEYSRAYLSGGTAINIRQLDVLSGKTQSMSVYYGTALTLTGTGIDLVYASSRAGETIDLLVKTEALKIRPSGGFAIRFQANSTSGLNLTATPTLHGSTPWEDGH